MIEGAKPCPFTQDQLRDTKGRLKTQSLFFEYRHRNTGNEIYNLKDYDLNGCISMYKIYMEEPTEYHAAMRLLGSWLHWNRLCETAWFRLFLDVWRKERAERDEALGYASLLDSARDGNVAASRVIAGIDQKKRGAPSKKEKAKTQKEEDELLTFVKKSELIRQGIKH